MTEYWKNRFLKSTKDVFDSNDQYVAEIFKMYKGAAENIDRDILGILNSMDEVSMSEAKKLLNKKEVKSFRNNLSDFTNASKGFITQDLEKELDVASKRVRISRLQAMQLSLKSNVAVLLNKEQQKLFAHLSNQYTSSYYEDLYELQRITGYEQINKLSPSFVEEVLNTSWANDGKNFSDRIWARKDKLISTLDTNLRQGLITGRSPDKISAEISHELSVSKSNAKRLVQTESAAIHASSRKSMFNQMGVEKYEILATLDTRTTEICRGLDGKIFNVKDYEVGITAPPFHVYCRSTTIPYFDDDIQDEIVERRAARNVRTGKSTTVPDMTYKKWYKKYVEDSTVKPKSGYNNTRISDAKNFEDLVGALNAQGKTLNKSVLDLNFDAVKRTLVSIEDFSENYPGAYKNIKRISTTSPSDSIIMESNGDGINFNPYFYKDKIKLEEILKAESDKGNFIPNTNIEVAGVHEFGHVINFDLIKSNPEYKNSDDIIRDWNRDITAERIVSQACEDLKETPYGKGKLDEELRESQSKYGSENAAEAIAESYADIYANKEGANPLSKRIVEIIDELFKDYKRRK